MAKTPKPKIIPPLDLLLNPINIGSFVAFTHHSSMNIGQVIKITTRMIRIKLVKRSSSYSYLKHPREVVILNDELLAIYLLKI